jgi:hypothetical protein
MSQESIREALYQLNQTVNKYLEATRSESCVAETEEQKPNWMAKHAPQFPQQDFDPDFDADAPKYLEPAPEQPEEWDEEEDVDLGWSQIDVDPSTFVTFEAQTPVEPLGIDYWLENTPADRETATDIVEEVKKRHSENWGTKPDWQYGDSV